MAEYENNSVDAIMPQSDESLQSRTQSYSNNDRKMLKKLQKAGLHEIEWLETAIDPFHDTALETGGYPDFDSTSSIVQVVKKVHTITPPPGLTAEQTWDMNLFTTGMEYTSPNGFVTDVSGCDFNVGGQQLFANEPGRDIGFLTYFASETNAHQGTLYPTNETRDIWINDPTAVFPPIANGALSPVLTRDSGASAIVEPDEPFITGPHRVIGYAFELVNTTAPLYVQGGIVCYKQNRANSISMGQGFRDENQQGRPVEVNRFKGPPTTLEEAMLLPDSRLWHAKHGAYVVGTQQGIDNPFQQNIARVILATTLDQEPGEADAFNTPVTPASTSTICFADLQQSGPGTAPGITFGNKCVIPWNQQGVWATGLSPQTRFQLNLRVIIERAPTLDEKQLVVLAKPSPPADELAWRVYSECVRRMPPGVQLRENWTGKWFSDAIKTVASTVDAYAPAARAAAPFMGPEFMLAVEAGDLAAKYMKGKNNKKKDNRVKREVLQLESAELAMRRKKAAKARKRRQNKRR